MSGQVLNVIKRVDLCYFYFIFMSMHEILFIKLILIYVSQAGILVLISFFFFLMNNTHWLFYWIGNISVSVVQKSIQHTSLYSLCLLFPVHFNSFNKKRFFKILFWYLGHMYLYATLCGLLYKWLLCFACTYKSYKYSRICAPIKALFSCIKVSCNN